MNSVSKSADFEFCTRSQWTRLEEKEEQYEARPHIVPLSPLAIEFMEAYAIGSIGCDSVIGVFYDPISMLETERGTIYALRFLTATEREGAVAMERTMARFNQWKARKLARRLPKSTLFAHSI